MVKSTSLDVYITDDQKATIARLARELSTLAKKTSESDVIRMSIAEIVEKKVPFIDIDTTEKGTRINLPINDRLKEMLVEYADRYEIPVSKAVRFALETYFEQYR